MLGVVQELLRSPHDLARRCRDGVALPSIGAASLACIAVGCSVFGGVLGATRGGTQILYSSIKLPLAVLLTLALTVPAFHAVARAVGRPLPLHATTALGLAALARFALVLTALAPGLWLLIDGGVGYHGSIVLAALAYALAFLAALRVVGAGIGPGAGRALALTAFTLVLTTAGAQTTWVMRPYVGRPAQDEVPFVRSIEGNFVDAIVTSQGSWASGATTRRERGAR